MAAVPSIPSGWLLDVELELRRREAARRGVARLEGIVLLPAMTPKPEPPADFWAVGEGPSARVPSARSVAEARLRELMREKRAAKPQPKESSA